MEITIINGEQVRQLLPMRVCIKAMHAAMHATSQDKVDIPPRLGNPLIDGSGYFFLMPGSTTELPFYGTKIIGQHPANPDNGLPAIQGFVALFDRKTGSPVALIDGAEITAIRTAAASGLATQLLANPEAATCGILGTGIQAVTHIEAICCVRDIEEVRIWGRSYEKAKHVAQRCQRPGIKVFATEDIRAAANCDIVNTVTAAIQPILLGEWVTEGAHVNLIGAHNKATREADSQLLAKSTIYCDSLVSLFNESGDILIPLEEGAIEKEQIEGEIGQLIGGEIRGRQTPEQITLYKSLGIISQDLWAAATILEAAREKQIGTVINF